MKGDFSRDTFDPQKNFLRVLMQQGRVQLDADWNEQVAILLHYIQTLAADLIGPGGGPETILNSAGKLVENFEISLSKENDEVTVTVDEGRYYVQGVLCNNPSSRPFTFNNLDTETTYLLYLDAWEQHVTALEDDSIREKALGGADTASRTRVQWEVKHKDLASPSGEGNTETNNNGDMDNTCKNILDGWDTILSSLDPRNRGLLKARLKNPDDNTPCLTPPDARYRGTENHLYRVEIHTGGAAGEATFKWSRDNGSIVTACQLGPGENVLTLDNPDGFSANQWVELTSEEQELRGEPGRFARTLALEGHELTLTEIPKPPEISADEKWPTKIRLWDTSEIRIEEAVNGKEDKPWLGLEDGIEIQFQKAPGDSTHTYRTGDYWLIPARTNDPDGIEWPNGSKDPTPEPIAQPPKGIQHYFAPLGILSHSNGSWDITDDCRRCFPPIPICDIQLAP